MSNFVLDATGLTKEKLDEILAWHEAGLIEVLVTLRDEMVGAGSVNNHAVERIDQYLQDVLKFNHPNLAKRRVYE